MESTGKYNRPAQGAQTRSTQKSCAGIPLFADLDYLVAAAAAGSLERRHHRSSWLTSVISMPGMTMNLQDCISRGSSSSGSWQVTRQYWQS
jgi:hypothetical protein